MHPPSSGNRLAIGLSPASQALLQRLHQRGHVDTIATSGTAEPSLRMHWQSGHVVVFVGAVGAVTRLIAPHLQGKERDPAVLVLDPRGQWCIPLLGGHSSGAEQLARELAADLGGLAVLTGACASEGRLALDAVGHAWGWRRGGSTAAWRQLMQGQARGTEISVRQTAGVRAWHEPDARSLLRTVEELSGDPPISPQLSIGPEIDAPCRWHPATLWLGVGCERHTSTSLVERAIQTSLAESGLAIEAVAGLASAERKADETALLEITAQQSWPFQTFAAEQLDRITVPTPSERVRAEMGTGSVAEAAALLAAGNSSVLRQSKRIHRPEAGEHGAVTVAIAETAAPFAPQRGELHLIGSGPGDPALLSGDARKALERCVAWVGYSLYLDLLEPLRRRDQVRIEGRLTREWERCSEALAFAKQGAKVALISSGDSGIYGMAGLALELWLQEPADARPSFTVHPGISALQLAAAQAGAPLMHDFCTVSLSDRLTPWPVIEQRLEAAGEGDFVVALYNPRSRDRDWQLERAQQILLAKRSGETPVVLARQLGRAEEEIRLTTLDKLEPASVDMLTVVLIGNSSSYAQDGRMVTPRGYPGATLH